MILQFYIMHHFSHNDMFLRKSQVSYKGVKMHQNNQN